MSSGRGWIDKFVLYTENTEPPDLYKEWVAVFTVAAALKRKVWVEWSLDERIYPNLYVVLVGPPGRCRKGTAIRPAVSLIRDLGIKLAAKSITREALIRELEDVQDMTQAADKSFITHSSLNILSPELTVFLGYGNNQLIMDLTDWYDCDDNWEYRTKTQGNNEIAGVWVNLLGATTPKSIQRALPLESISGGLASRIIFVYEDRRSKKIPDPFVTPEQLVLRKELLLELGRIQQMSGQFKLTPEAMDRWTEWYITMEKTAPHMPPTFEGYVNRRQTHVRKLSMVLSASRSKDMAITLQDFNNAVDLLERTEVKMARTFAGLGTSKNSELIVDLMEYISSVGEVSIKTVYGDFYGYIEGPRHFQELLHVLTAQGFCKTEPRGRETFLIYLKTNAMHAMYGGNKP